MLKKILLAIVFLGLVYGVYYAWQALPILSGYGAKNLCTCVFVADRTVESVLADELGSSPLNIGTFSVNYTDSSATGNVFGLASKKAIYRKGLGCTLISEVSEEVLRAKDIPLSKIKEPIDTLLWPFGSMELNPKIAGVDYDKLQMAVDNAFLENNPETKINTRAVVVVYNNFIIAEKYAEGFDKNTPQIGWSMTKSVTATMAGMMIKDGLISLEDKGLYDHWLDDERKEITLDHLLRMSSGLEWEEDYAGPSSATNMLFRSADMGLVASKQPLAYAPDERWYYSSGTTNIISKYLHNKLGEKYHNYIRERLFSPLGMTSAVIEPDASGTYVGSSYMYATPRDWAKFGLLYLNEGVWNNEQLFPDNWTSYVAEPTPKAPKGNYGGQFWLNAGEDDNDKNRVYPDAPTDLYSANGFEGQRVFIIPSKNLVIVRLGQTKVRGSFDFNKFLKEVIASIE